MLKSLKLKIVALLLLSTLYQEVKMEDALLDQKAQKPQETPLKTPLVNPLKTPNKDQNDGKSQQKLPQVDQQKLKKNMDKIMGVEKDEDKAYLNQDKLDQPKEDLTKDKEAAINASKSKKSNPFDFLDKLLDKEEEEVNKENIQSTEGFSRDKVEIKLNQRKDLLFNSLVLDLTEEILQNEYLLIEVKGMGKLELTVIHPDKDDTLEYLGDLNLFGKTLMPVQLPPLKHYVGKKLQFALKNIFFNQKMTLGLTTTQTLQVNFNKQITLASKFVNNLKIRVENSLSQEELNNKNNRIQFILKSNIDGEEFQGEEMISMQINKGEEFPTRKKQDMIASGKLGFGLIKTVNSKNKFYCMETNCVYSVNIEVNELDEISFYPSVFPNESSITFKKSLKLLEQIVDKEEVSYQLKVPKKDGQWVFNLNTKQGGVQMFLNPDDKLKKVENSKFSTSGHMNNSIVITQEEIEQMKISGEIFWITFKASNQYDYATFNLSVEYFDFEQKMQIEDDTRIDGVLVAEEIQNYYLNLFTGDPETFKIRINFQHSSNGVGELLINECEIQDEFCDIDEGDNKLKSYKKKALVESQKIIEFKINCMGNDPFQKQNIFKNDYDVSASCKFVIGVKAKKFYDTSNNELPFVIEISGNTMHQQMILDQSYLQEIPADDVRILRWKVINDDDLEYLVFNINMLEGNCMFDIFQGFKNYQEQNSKKHFEMENESNQQVVTQNKMVGIKMPKEKFQSSTYLQIESEQSCVFEIYASLVSKFAFKHNLMARKLNVDMIQIGRLTKDQKREFQGKTVHYQEYYVEMPLDKKGDDDFDIVLNSQVIGLEICIQFGVKEFNPEKKCDDSSQTGHLKLQEKSYDKIAIMVYKSEKESSLNWMYPIQFNIFAHFKSEESKIHFILPGQIYNHSLGSKESFLIKVDLTRMNQEALFLLTTHSINIKADFMVSAQSQTDIMTLDHSKFGFSIENARKFKKKHCKKFKCALFVNIRNTDTGIAKFTFNYLIDDQALVLSQGTQLYIPSHKKMFMLYKTNKEKTVYFTFENEFTKSVAFANILEEEMIVDSMIQEEFISESDFQYKTGIRKDGELVMSPKDLGLNKGLILIMIVPKFGIVQKLQNIYQIFTHKDKTRVTLHSKIIKLKPYDEQSSKVAQGDFIYYLIDNEEEEDFEIFLTVHSGKAQIYLNQGIDNFPTVNNYLKKGDNFHDKEIRVTMEEFKRNKDIIGSYVIGVHGQQSSMFTISFISKANNVRRLYFQKLRTVKLEKNKFMYFDIVNSKETYDTYLYSDSSDIEVALMVYDTKKGQHFLNSVENQFSIIQKFIYKKSSPPRLKESLQNTNDSNHYIVRVRALDQDCHIDFTIYNKKESLITPANRSTLFALDRDYKQKFLFKLSEDYLEADVDIKLHFGDINVKISDDSSSGESFHLNKPQNKIYKYKDNSNLQKKNDLVIFKNVYVEVEARILSQFSIRLTPVSKYKQLKKNEAEIFHLDSTQDQYFFFTIEQSDLIKIRNLEIDVENIVFYDDDPELLFISNQDIEINEDSPYLPMALVDRRVIKKRNYRKLEIFPSVDAGNYILKFKPNSNKIPIKISYHTNSVKMLEVNGSFIAKVPPTNKRHSYQIYLPRAGEIRILLENCLGVKIINAAFVTDEETPVNLEDQNYAQLYPLMRMVEQKREDGQRKSSITIPVNRYLNSEKGLFKFDIVHEGEESDKNYEILTEFRPNNKNLILKDYVEVYGKENEEAYEYTFENKRIQFKFRVPQFKPQLKRDYNDIKFIKIDFHIYLFSHPDFFGKLNQCGMNSVEYIQPKPKHHTVSKKISIDQIRDESFISASFYQSELNDFNNVSVLTLFSHLQIYFLQDENEEYDITLDQKYTDVPFFVLELANDIPWLSMQKVNEIKEQSLKQIKTNSSIQFSFIAFIVFILLFIMCKFCKRNQNPEIIVNTDQYFKKTEENPEEPSQLEMVEN